MAPLSRDPAPPVPIAVEAARSHPLRRIVLDVRAEPEFAAGHLAGSGSLPAGDLDARRSELPAREVPLLVVGGDAGEARAAAQRLHSSGFRDVAYLDGALASLDGGLASRDPAVPLWRAAPYLVERLPSIPRGRALDLAAGFGREAVHLAIEGFQVEAWDVAAEALAAARALAARHGVAITTAVRDLEAPEPPAIGAPWDLIVCFRYLHRPLLPWIARALAPGGHLLYETFRAGQERFGRPRRGRFLLEPGELRAAFSGLQILHADEPDPPGGPVTARLHARRPAR